MWIVPKNHQLSSQFAPDMLDSKLDLNELSEISTSSLMWRSSPSASPIWSKRWRRVCWLQHLSGRILRPSRQKSFQDALTTSLVATPARIFPKPANEQALQASVESYGVQFAEQFDLFAPDSASLKTSKDICRLDSTRCSQTWESLVTVLRSAYTQRQKQVRPISETGSLSWPTARVSDTKGGGETTEMTKGGFRTWREKSNQWFGSKLRDAVENVHWPTIRTEEPGRTTKGYGRGLAELAEGKEQLEPKPKKRGPSAPAPTSTLGNHQGHWAANNQTTGKLSPRWVEMLMGLPLGWTSPDCPVSVIRNWKKFTTGWNDLTTELMNSEVAETESYPNKPKSQSET
jgi:hypothetical protein